MKEEVKIDALQQQNVDEWLYSRLDAIVEKIKEIEDAVVKLRIDLFHKADEALQQGDEEARWRFLNLASWLEGNVEWYLYKARKELEDY
jgi:hypothetical protein